MQQIIAGAKPPQLSEYDTKETAAAIINYTLQGILQFSPGAFRHAPDF